MNDFIDFDNLDTLEPDPAVSSLLTKGRRRQEEAHLSPKQRQKRAKERSKARGRNRVMYDLPPAISERIKQIAAGERLNCPESQVATVLLAAGLAQLEAGQLDLERFKRVSGSPRYTFNLRLEGTPLSRYQGHPLKNSRDTP